jgi:putative nucleotidyltransferase with HDIG domain
METEVDLGEVRYALYDLLEVVREHPSSILAEVFRRTERDYFERHHVNVAVLAILTADQLGATLSDVIDLGTAAMLHDIGMSDSREAWDADVRLAPKVFDTTIRQHPERGQERLKQIPGMTPDISRIVREEHERLDGTGYPDGLAGDTIDPGARIVAVCDTLEALTHARPYRERLTLGEALSRLHILGQYTLDMAVVQTLTDALTEYMPSLDGSDEA